MAGIKTPIALIACENIQIRGLKMYAVFQNLLKVTFDIVGGLSDAEIALPAARPAAYIQNRAIGGLTGKLPVKGGGVKVIISVLVMQAEHIAAVFKGIGERLKPFPAGIFAGGEIVGMLIVIFRLTTAVEVEIVLVHAFFPCSA